MPVGFPKGHASAHGPEDATYSGDKHDLDVLGSSAVARPDTTSSELSIRELEVLRQVASGLSDKQVAGQLGISQKTVRNHLTRVYGKLRAGNRVEAVTIALRLGLVSL
ncbi:MAG TPA: LuxR C-terminal-related transcriptional regulator [Candidatus Dormibacteraeota bacterium]|nr:LuxR C-terminal-related transcriptional regulator [Candidatus Dormibacteraeota bacterium]